MTDDEKKAEQRGYSRGYQAGRKRQRLEINREREQLRRDREERAFRDRAFLAALPFCMGADGWTIGDKKISSSEERVEFAWRVANRATRKRREHNP